MGNIERKRNGYGQIALTALCAAGLFSVIYIIRKMYPFGDGSIVITDLYSQYVPLLYRFYDVVTGQKNLFLDFSVSGGANLYVDTINEVLNPFNYVLLLFGRSRIYQSVNLVLLLYVTAAAASANFFLLKIFPKSRDWNVILSLCYAFSGYMAYNYQIIKWMYFPVLFPLFCLALYRLFLNGRGSAYAVLLGYQFVLSVQLGFMALLFTLFGSGIYLYVCVKKERRPELMCRLGVYTVIGLFLSGAVLVPNIFILLSSSRAGENLSYFGVMKRHGLDDLFERLFQIAHPVLLALLVWCTAGKYRGGRKKENRVPGIRGGRRNPAAALRRRKDEFEKLSPEGRFLICLNLFLWLTVLLQPANLLWHMGSYVCFPVRYAYMVLLSGICLVKWMLEARKAAQKRGAALGKGRKIAAFLCLLLSVGACLFVFFWEERIVQAFSSLAISLVCPKETAAVCLVLGLFFASALCALAGSAGRRLTACVTVLCGLCLNLFIMLPDGYGVRLSNEAAYQRMAQQADGRWAEGENLLQRVKDDPELPLNAPLVNGRSSLSGYFPTASRSFKDAMESLGYLVPWVATQSVGGTEASDTVLSEGLLFDRGTDELLLTGDSVLERQKELTVLAAGESCLDVIAGGTLEKDAAGAVSLAVKGEKRLYLDPGMTADGFLIKVNGEPLEIPEASSAYGPHRIVELGTFSEEEITVMVTDKNGTPLSAEGMEFGAFDGQKWKAAAGQKNARKLAGDELEIDAAAAQICVKLSAAAGGQTVFLPVAALDGWRCTENGKDVDIVSVFGGFLGITAEAGRNEFVLAFVPRGLRAGLSLTVLGFAVLLALWLWEKSASAAVGSVREKREDAAGGSAQEENGAAAAGRAQEENGAAAGGRSRKQSGAAAGRSAEKGMDELPRCAGNKRWLTAAVSRLYGLLFWGGLIGIYLIPAAGLVIYLAAKASGIGA